MVERQRLRRESWILAGGELVSVEVGCRKGIFHRQPKKRQYLLIRAFAVFACNKNTKEHAPAQKTPSEKKWSRLFVSVFAYVYG
jgi:hypothetical protein